MGEFVKVARADKIAPDEALAVEAGGRGRRSSTSVEHFMRLMIPVPIGAVLSPRE